MVKLNKHAIRVRVISRVIDRILLSLLMLLFCSYVPPVWGRSGHVQTFFAGKVGRVNPPKLQGKHHEIRMNDGATMTFDVYEPNDTKPEEV